MKHQRLLALTVLFAILLALAGCGSSSGDAGYAKSDYAPGEYYDYEDGYGYYAETMAPVTTAAATAAPSAQREELKQNDSARKLIKTVHMEMETKEFDACLRSIEERISAFGGYVESSDVRGGSSYSRYYTRSANLTARIPADQLDAFTEGVSSLANVTARTENASDVTSSYYDMQSHVKALRSEYDTLLGILEKCTELKDVISVQSRITEVLYQIESYESMLKNYDNLVTYSTVHMSLSEVERETVVVEQTVGTRMTEGLSRTMDDVREGLQDFAVDFVTNLPYIVIWLVLIVVLVLVIRALYRRQRRRSEKKKESK